MDVTYRALTLSDASAVVEIMQAAEAAEPADAFTSLAEIEDEMTRPEVDLRRGSVAAIVAGRLVGFGSLISPPATGQWISYLTGSVHPDFRGHRIGASILAHLVERATDLRAATDAALPGELK